MPLATLFAAACGRRSGSTGFSSSRSFPMSSSPLATALVVPLEQLRMTDVEAVGGKNASLGEMISQLAGSGVRVPGGFATTAHAFRDLPEPRRSRRRASPSASRPRRRRRARAGRGRRADPRLDRGDAVSAGLRGGDPCRVREARSRPARCLVRGALVGDRRGPAGRVVRRPAGDLPQRRRHRRGARARCARSSPASTTTARSATASTRAMRTATSRCRPACSAWCAPTSARPA